MKLKGLNQNDDVSYIYKDLLYYSLGKGPVAAALCYTHDGVLLAAKSYYRHSHFEGEINVLDPDTLRSSRKLIDRPAKALCSNPDGTLLAGTCDYSITLGCAVGSIDVLDSTSGQFKKTLIAEPASALCYRPDGNLLASTCYYSVIDGSVKGSIVIRDASSGQYKETLIEEPASALCYLPGGMLLTSICYSTDKKKRLRGHIVMRDPLTGQIIRKLDNDPASAMCFTPADGLLVSAFYNDIRIGVGVSTTRWYFNKELYCKYQQKTFVDSAIEVANVYYAPIENQEKPHLSIFSIEILFRIVLECSKDMNEVNAFECFKLILQNFELRRDLIEKGKYIPEIDVTRDGISAPDKGIFKWWSQVTRDKEQKRIFRTSSSFTLFKQPLPKPIEEKITCNEHKKNEHYKKCQVM